MAPGWRPRRTYFRSTTIRLRPDLARLMHPRAITTIVRVVAAPRSVKWKLLACLVWLMSCAAIVVVVAFAVYLTRPEHATKDQLQPAGQMGAGLHGIIGIGAPAGLFFILKRPGLG